MTAKEKKVADVTGKFIHPLIRGDTRHKDASWTPGRIILSNKNLWLVTNDGKDKIPLQALQSIGGKFDLNQSVVKAQDYVSVVYKKGGERHVTLMSSDKGEAVTEIRNALFNILLNREIVFVKHPVVKGGVMQEEEEWEKAQLVLGDDVVRLGTEGGDLITVDLESVQDIEKRETEFKGESRTVLSIEHADESDVTVVTYVYSKPIMRNALTQYVSKDFEEEVKSEIELGQEEKQIIMALYSGVSPFDIPNFIGEDVDDVEELYEKLIQMDVLSEVRKRREVTLTTRGRNLASKAMGEE